MGFSRQEYWSGLPFPSPGDFPHPGIEPRSPALQADSLPSEQLEVFFNLEWEVLTILFSRKVSSCSVPALDAVCDNVARTSE